MLRDLFAPDAFGGVTFGGQQATNEVTAMPEGDAAIISEPSCRTRSTP
jgi:hypothetical protein